MKEVLKPEQAPKANEGKEMVKPLRPDQLPIAQHVEAFMKGLPDPEIASIEQGINALVDVDYVRMERKWHSTIAAVFFSERKALRQHGLSLELATLVGQKFKETRWGKLMLTKIGMDIKDGNTNVMIRPLLASNSGSNAALQTGMNASALYLKSLYGWPAIPKYTVEGAGVSEDDIVGHDPRIKEARRTEVEAGKPTKIEHKK